MSPDEPETDFAPPPTSSHSQQGWLRRTLLWIGWRREAGVVETADGQGRENEGRALLLKILIVMVWIPIQVVLSLVFATGGFFSSSCWAWLPARS